MTGRVLERRRISRELGKSDEAGFFVLVFCCGILCDMLSTFEL